MRLTIACLSVLGIASLALAGAPVWADTLYSNGSPNFTTDALTINSGFSVTDSFVLSGNAEITGFDIGVWQFPGDSLTSVQVDFGTMPFGTNMFSGVVATTSFNDLGFNRFGYYDLDLSTRACAW